MSAVAYTADDSEIVVVSMDNVIRIWQANTGEHVRRHTMSVVGTTFIHSRTEELPRPGVQLRSLEGLPEGAAVIPSPTSAVHALVTSHAGADIWNIGRGVQPAKRIG